MSVLSHLDNVASNFVLTSTEQASITTSINTLKSRINAHFSSNVKEHFQFGSSTRDTILPRKYDERSDIDFMIIFNNPNNYKPQTLLNWLKDFVEKYYSKSEIFQSHPTIVLELLHIKFELVPAMKDAWGNISIPSPSSSYADWMSTDPNGLNKKVTDKNTSNNYKIKPLIRLMKYWNVKKVNRGYCSFGLETWIVDRSFYGCTNLKDYLFKCFDDLSYSYNDHQHIKDAVDKTKQVIANVRQYEKQENNISAESEIKKIIPDI